MSKNEIRTGIMGVLKSVAKCVLILAGGCVLGTVLLMIAFLLPVNHKSLDDTTALLDGESWYPIASQLVQGDYFGELEPDVLDNSTDQLMLSTAMDDSEGNVLVRAMNMYSDYSGNYSYYWHGYVAILRPLTLMFSYRDIRVLNSMLQILLIIMLAHTLYRKKGVTALLLLLTSFFLLLPIALSFSLQYTWIFYIAGIFALVILCKQEFFEKSHRIWYAFLIGGMLTSYFDLLTYPLFTWGFPLLLWIFSSKAVRPAFEWLKEVVITGIFWILGYGGLWYLKCVLATWILDRDVLQMALDEAFFRAGTAEQATWHTRLEAITINWDHYSYKVYLLIFALWFFWLFLRSFTEKWVWDTRYFAFCLVGVSPVVWYILLSNHTGIHHMFTYRIFNISVMAFLSCMLAGLSGGKKKPISWKSIAFVFGKWGVAVVAALFLVSFCTEETRVSNEWSSGEDILKDVSLPNLETWEMTFIPQDKRITGLKLCIDTQSTEGYYLIELHKGDKVISERKISMESVKGVFFFSVDVDWKLEIGEEYSFRLIAIDGNSDNYMRIVTGGELFLEEFPSGIRMGDNIMEGQPIAAIYYLQRKMPEGKQRVFLWLTYIGICLVLEGTASWIYKGVAVHFRDCKAKYHLNI